MACARQVPGERLLQSNRTKRQLSRGELPFGGGTKAVSLPTVCARPAPTKITAGIRARTVEQQRVRLLRLQRLLGGLASRRRNCKLSIGYCKLQIVGTALPGRCRPRVGKPG